MSIAERKGPAAERYEALVTVRSPYLTAAYESAKLTIPSLFPEAGDANQNDRNRKALTVPNQGLGARGVNNVASKLLLTLLPPSRPVLKYQIAPNLTNEAADDEAQQEEITRIEAMLAQREIDLSELIEADAIRPVIHEALRQLIVAGNICLNLPDKKGMRAFKLNRYVVKRDSYGTVVEAIIKETLTEDTLPETIRKFVQEEIPFSSRQRGTGDNDTREDEVNLYTHIRIQPGGETYSIYQEVEGLKIEDTVGTYPADAPEYIFLRMSRVDGEDYGRGMVEENVGDLQSYDSLQLAITVATACASDVKWLVDPNGETNIRHLRNSASGSYVAGRKKDVESQTLDKGGDLQVGMALRDDLRTSLSFVFLLNSAVRRQGERVTAEEIREVARELEDSFGGVYTILSQDLQLPIVKRRERLAERDGLLRPLPKINGKEVVKPVIITGLESIGRSQDLDKIRQFFIETQAVFQSDPGAGDYFETSEALKRIGTAIGIPLTGLIKSEEEVQAQREAAQQQAQQAELIGKLGPPAINQMGPAIAGQNEEVS